MSIVTLSFFVHVSWYTNISFLQSMYFRMELLDNRVYAWEALLQIAKIFSEIIKSQSNKQYMIVIMHVHITLDIVTHFNFCHSGNYNFFLSCILFIDLLNNDRIFAIICFLLINCFFPLFYDVDNTILTDCRTHLFR